jgi:hypothetical protein
MTNENSIIYNEDIGVIFRYQDENNYYLIRWEENDNNDKMYLWKFVNGVKYELDQKNVGLIKGKWYTIGVNLNGDHISVSVSLNTPLPDESLTQVFDLYDNSISSGSIGLFCWKNTKAWFDNVLVLNPENKVILEEGFDYPKQYGFNGQYFEWEVVDEAPGSPFWKTTKYSVDQEDFYVQPDYVYRILNIVAHYNKNDIIYLSADKWRDADGDGKNDVTGYCYNESIRYVMMDWLPQMSDSNDINLIYIFDHGGYKEEDQTSFFVVDDDRNGLAWDEKDRSYIHDYTIDDWLPEYGENIDRLTFIIEACYIGHFIDSLSHPNEERNIIVSTDIKPHSAGGDTGSDWPAFSHRLFKEMADGSTDFMEAFNEAYYHVTVENFLSIEYLQDPKLDDDGQPPGHDNLPNGGDGYKARKTGL